MKKILPVVLGLVALLAGLLYAYTHWYMGPHDQFDATTHITLTAKTADTMTFRTWVESPVPVTVRSDIGWDREDYTAWGIFRAERTVTVATADLWAGVMVALMGDNRLGWHHVPFRCEGGISVTGDVDAVGHEAVWHYEDCYHPDW